jgi:hypothetical protein
MTDYFSRLALKEMVIANAPENTLSPVVFQSEAKQIEN